MTNRATGGPTVDTRQGKLEGIQAERHQAYLGIPFAQPPVGELRFRAPQPPAPWSGMRSAQTFGLAAPQVQRDEPLMQVGPQSEDCLYLNVYTPGADLARRPVFVWIHGGGFTAGSASQAIYYGGPLAERGDVVVVTINYRVGALGYACFDQRGGASWGATANAGQLDQIAALEWVRDNIAAFGGDPGAVTVAGESAGAYAATTLLTMPAARGLFHRVIAQSGTAYRWSTPEVADRLMGVLLEELGSSDPTELRAMDVRAIVRAQTRAVERLGGENRGPGFTPVFDGRTIPEQPLLAVRAGAARDIPVITGTNRDETKLYPERQGVQVDDARLEHRVRALLGRRADAAPKLIDTYRKSRASLGLKYQNVDISHAISTDHRFRIPAVRLAEAQSAHQPRTYHYLFSYESPGFKASVHGMELPFMFGTHEREGVKGGFAGTGPDADRLAGQMMDAWIGFIRHGDPSGVLPWAPYESSARQTQVFDRRSELVSAPFDDERRAWDGIIP